MSNAKVNSEATELQSFKTVLYHSVVILALPVIAFFTSKVFLFDGILGLTNIRSNVYSAGIAVLVLHVALGAFIYRAYFDDRSRTPAVKRD
ncbi:vacuolar ATPase assembly integral membrane protein VMA21 homolog [Linepithema humile]|uniref:vacuolar ATPase assembly integral membrane protein VMA21 homolog n=1 Tax=Linepithema humile TaxID=83485 RepID=UPI0006235BD2|nr:PREDICTED: vacuolar ATPase assembly integral membrane protein VMA21 homolog [Linepithema humile]